MTDQLLNMPTVDMEWPQKATLDFSDTCLRIGLEEELTEIQTDLAALAALSKAMAPVVGIVGGLNAGKTSTIKRFLSARGRERAPSGLRKASGTQRFVFWLPASWEREPEVWESFKGVLEALFGNRLERLSEDPKLAGKQYRGDGEVAELMAIPLYAFDEGLDDYGFALMDSPDMERAVEGIPGETSSEIRIKLVKQALKGLSAILFVCNPAQVGLNVLARRLSQKEDLPAFLLLNSVGCAPGELEDIVGDDQVKELTSNLRVTEVFCAFNGRFEGAHQRISEAIGDDKFDPDLPQYFKVSPSMGQEQPPVLLEQALSGLKPAELWQQWISEKRRSIELKASSCFQRFEPILLEHEAHLQKTRDVLLQFIWDQIVVSDNELAIPLTASTAAQIAEAVIEHAPIYAKPTMLVNRHLIKAMQYLVRRRDNIKAVLKPTEQLKHQAEKLQKEIPKNKVGRFHPEIWAKRSQSQKFMPNDVDRATLEELWRAVGEKALELDFELDIQALRKFAEALWAQVPWWKKAGLLVGAPIFMVTGLAALVLAFVDGGTSGVVWLFSVNQILVFLGVGAAVTPAFMAGAGKALEADLIKRAAIPYYNNLIMGALDSFGLPRSGLPPVTQKFSNTGEIVLDLTSPHHYQPLAKRVDLSGGCVLGKVRWDAASRLGAIGP